MSKQPKHTPAPWAVREDQPFTFRVISPVTKEGLAICGSLPDAHLIAAGPEMLEMLENMVDVLTILTKGTDKELYGQIKLEALEQLITKAKGG